MRPAFKIITVLLLVLTLGLHWVLLQTVAWTGMIVSYSRDASFTEAVSKTFDGQHPCKMCKVIKQARADEKQQEQQQVKPSAKADLGLIWQNAEFHFSSDHEKISSPDTTAPRRSDEPPKPRPRLT